MYERKSYPLIMLVTVLLAASVDGAAAAQRCQGGYMIDDQTGRPVMSKATGKPIRCDFYSQDLSDQGGDKTGLALFGAALVAGGTIAGLGASGAFSSGGTTPTIPVFPTATPVALSNQ